MFLTLQIILNICDSWSSTSLDREILNFLEFYWLLTLGVNLKIVGLQWILILQIDELERFLLVWLFNTFLVLGESLSLHHSPLIALALKDALLALVLRNFGDGRIVLVLLVAAIALWRSGSLHFVGSLSGIVPLFHDISLGYVVHVLLLVVNLVIFFEMLGERLLMMVAFTAFTV